MIWTATTALFSSRSAIRSASSDSLPSWRLARTFAVLASGTGTSRPRRSGFGAVVGTTEHVPARPSPQGGISSRLAALLDRTLLFDVSDEILVFLALLEELAALAMQALVLRGEFRNTIVILEPFVD
jgi:hypothetical protein